MIAVVIVILVIAGGYVITSVYHQATPASTNNTYSTSNKTITQNKQNKPAILEIAYGSWGLPSPYGFYPRGPGYVMTSFVFDTLTWKSQTGVIPWIADHWYKINDTTWAFHIRSGFTWSDGKPLTPEDVAFTYNYMARHGWQWMGANTSLIEKAWVKGNMVYIQLKKPYPFFVEEYASTIFILPMHIWENVSNPYSFASSKEAMIGSGPYVVEKIVKGQEIILKARNNYPLGKPKYNEIILNTRVNMFNAKDGIPLFKTGKTATLILQGKDIKLFASKLGTSYPSIQGHMYWALFLAFNTGKYPGNNTLFREAVIDSINDTMLINNIVGKANAVPGAPGFIPPYSYLYNKTIPGYTYNPQTTRRLLAKLGLVDTDGDGYVNLPGGGDLMLKLIVFKKFLPEATLVKKMLGEAGIKVEVKTYPSMPALDKAVKTGDYDLVINGNGAVGTGLDVFFWINQGRFGCKLNTSDYASLLSQLYTSNQTLAVKIAGELQWIIAREKPCMVLYYPEIRTYYNPQLVTGLFYTYNGIDGGIPLPFNKLAFLTVAPAG